MPVITRQRQNTKRSDSVSIAAPLGGWNKRDALGAMDKLDAVTLTNFFPGTGSVLLRKGHTQHATGITGDVETLMTYSSGTANTMFAAAGTNIYDVTTAGAVGAASRASMTNARWQFVNFTTTANSYLLCVNGADKLQSWNGSAWNADGAGAPYDITGFDTATCPNISIFKNRIWLLQTGTLKAWYLPINAIGGAANSLDMSSLVKRGGYLMASMNWTLDAGYGVDDYLAFITSNGEVVVWRLTDPTTPSGIAMVGVYSLGAPIGRRCWLKYGGDLLLITEDGVVPMAASLQSSRLDPRVNITNKIQYAVSQAVTAYKANFGWQLVDFPKENQLYLNVPVNEGDSQQQYVQNNITKSWCNFTGWDAGCWETLNDELYFGGDGFVGHAWYGTVDDTSDIEGVALQSFQSYGGAVQKQCKMIRYHFLSDGAPTSYGNVNTDYDLSDNSAQLTASVVAFGVWDVGVWDAALWGSGLVASADWQGATGIGFSFAPFLKTSTQGISLEWVATDMLFEKAGLL